MSPWGLVLLACLTALSLALAWIDRGRYGHVVDCYTLGFLGFFWFRSALLVLEFDTPALPALAAEFTSRTVEDTLLVLCVWQTGVLVGLYLAGSRAAPGWAVDGGVGRAHPTTWLPVTVILAALSLLALAAVGSESGGLENSVSTSKVDKGLAGLFFLQFIPIAGMLWTANAALRSATALRSFAYWLAAAGFSGAVLAWGSRRVVLILLVVVMLGLAKSSAPDVRSFLRAREVLRVVVPAAPIVMGLALWLRVVRDGAIGGAVGQRLSEESLLTQVSLAMNATYFEALSLVQRDFPGTYERWGGRPFVNGLAGVVPRALWPGKPDGVAIGAEFRQLYEPLARNGWPVGSVGEWLIAFGLAGVVVGSVVSGVALGLAGNRLQQTGALPYAAAIGLQVLELGFGGQSIVRWVGWVLPTALLVWGVTWLIRVSRRTTPTRLPGARQLSSSIKV